VHRAATAYRKHVSIADNAARHASQHFLLKLDFKNFFTSLTAHDLETYFRLHPQPDFNQHDITNLKKILFWNKEHSGELVMSIGAPSSPMLSNILMYDFDSVVQSICEQRRVQYTRYADDLTFSTSERHVLREVKLAIEQLCREIPYPRLFINEPKTVHASRAKSRRVTGLTLTNEGSISVGRERKRLIRAQIHRLLNGKLEIDRLVELQGMLSFVKSVEPDFIEKLRRRYNDERLQAILPPS
jgi:RNA-directed DNA polymerase